MKFSCNQQVLAKALNTVSKAVTTRTTIPILKGILLRTGEDGQLTLAASDLDFSIEKKIDVNIEEEGSIVVMAKLFGEIVRKLPNEEITFELQENGNMLIKSLTTEFSIVTFPADEFPNIGEVEGVSTQLNFDRETLKEMIKKTAFSASIDETRGVIVGVLFEIEKNRTNLVALDGFRMAVCREPMINEKEEQIIISSRILNEINKIISEVDEENINLILGSKKAVILLEKTKIISRLIDGEFIKYKDILPKECQTKLTVGKSMLSQSIERASLLAKEGKNNLVKFTINENLLTITSQSEEGNVKEELIVEKEGENLEIGFNSKYIIDVLKVIEDDEVLLEFNSSTSPCLIKPIDGDKFEYLVLPVRIATH